MQTNTAKPDQVVQAVFSVCVPNEVIAGMMDVVGAVAGAEFIGQFQEYITAEKRPQFPEVMKQAVGCVALIGCDLDPELALETMERLAQTFPKQLSLIAISSRSDPGFLLRAMRAGCDDFLTLPSDPELLQAAHHRFQKGHLTLGVSTQGNGKVITLYGVKGGAGTTTLAVHLAMQLVRKHRKKVLLIDHQHELGHIALHLGIKEGVYHFDELLRNANRLDSALIEGFVTRHSSGLDVIPSPDSCARLPDATPEAMTRVMEDLRTRYDYILLDSSLQYVQQLPAIMNVSDEVALVCTPDVAALRDLVRRIEHLTLLTGFTSKLRVVINRSTSDDAVTTADIEDTIRFPISVSVPNNYAPLMRALNSGEPLTSQTRGPFTYAIAQWANRIVDNPALSTTSVAPPPKRRFLFGF